MLHDTTTKLDHAANIDKFYYVDYIIIIILLLLLRSAARVSVIQKHFCGQKLKDIHQMSEHTTCSASILWSLDGLYVCNRSRDRYVF